MPYVIFFKKVNKRSIVNYENENFHKYLLDFKKKLTTDKNVRVSYRRKNNNMGKFRKMIRDEFKAVINGGNGLGQNPVPNSPTPVNGVSLNDPAIATLLQVFIQALQEQGYISKEPLGQRSAAPTSNAAPTSVYGSTDALLKLMNFKNEILDPNFVPAAPAFDSNLAGGAGVISWGAANAATVKDGYKKLSDAINKLKALLADLQM